MGPATAPREPGTRVGRGDIPESGVEDDIGYWVDTVGSYCPWAAYVVAEE